MISSTARQTVLKTNAVFLGLFGTVSFLLDIRAIWFDAGPLVAVLRGEPATGIGSLESHGLAMVIAVWLWRASRATNPDRAWHVTGFVVHAFLATCNISLWRIFILCDVLPLGYVSTSLHVLFAIAQLACAMSASRAGIVRYR